VVASSSIPARFSAAAPTYDRHASVQHAVAEGVIGRLAGVPPPESILEVGAGTGILTEKLALAFPSAKITALDLSPRMVAQCRTRLAHMPNVEFLARDIRGLATEAPFDMAASSSSLHWISPVDDAFRAVAALIRPGARFTLGLMLEDTLAELHEARHHAAPRKTVRARLPRPDDVFAALESSGLRLLEHQRKRFRSEFDSCSDFLRAIHEQGFTGGPVSTSGVPLTRTELKVLALHYDSHYKSPAGGVFATYDCLLALAERA